MKKYILTAAVALVAAGMFSVALMAQEADEGAAEGDRAQRFRQMRQRRVEAAKGRLDTFIESLDLSEEKEATVREIFESQQEANAASRRENMGKMRELGKEYREARQSGDTEAMTAIREKMRASRGDRNANLVEQLEAELDEEQMAKVKTYLASRRRGRRGRAGRPRIFGALESLELTAEQQAQVRQILDKAEADVMKVLTPEQQEQLRTSMRLRRRGDGRQGEGRGREGRGGRRRGGRGRMGRGRGGDEAETAPENAE